MHMSKLSAKTHCDMSAKYNSIQLFQFHNNCILNFSQQVDKIKLTHKQGVLHGQKKKTKQFKQVKEH